MLSPTELPLLSVIIPVYNVGNYLSRCLESVMNQDFDSVEFIVVNDGSTDDSAAVIEHYASLDKRIRVVNKENGGVVCARKTGLEQARGKYIHYLDGDDYMEKNAYSELMMMLKANDADFLVFPFVFNYGDKQVASRPYLKQAYSSVEFLQACYTEKGYFAVWHYIHKKSLYDFPIDYNLNVSYGEDAYLTTQLAYYANKIVCISGKPFLHYMNRPESVSNQCFSKKIIGDFLLYPRLIESFLKDKPEYPLLGKEIASLKLQSYSNIVNAGYLNDIKDISKKAMGLYKQYPELIKQRSTKTYYKLFYLYHLNSVLGYLYSLYYKKKGKIKKTSY